MSLVDLRAFYALEKILAECFLFVNRENGKICFLNWQLHADFLIEFQNVYNRKNRIKLLKNQINLWFIYGCFEK